MKVQKILAVVFGTIGFIQLVVAFVIWQNTQDFVSKAVEAPGVVVDLVRSRSGSSSSYAPVVRFTTKKGKVVLYQSNTYSSPPSYRRGEKVQMLYLPGHPEEAKINSFMGLHLLPLIFGILGAVFFSIGSGFFLFIFLRKRRYKHLRQHGMHILTELQSVSHNTSVRMNGRHPFQITSQWQDPTSSHIHIFVSDDIWFDPTSFLPDEIPVWIERNNPKSYLVDLSFLPKKS